MYFFKIKNMCNEKIPIFINSLKLNKLLNDTKNDIIKSNNLKEDCLFYKNFSLDMILMEFYRFNDEQQEYIYNRIISKIDKGYLFRFYIQNLCYFSSLGKTNYVNDLLKSVKDTKLVECASTLSDDNNRYNMFEFILKDKNIIRFSNIPLDNDELEEYNGKCHFVTPELSYLVGAEYLDTVIEHNSIYKGHYHSYCVKDNTVFDFAHNIVINYDNYLKLINPVVLVHESYEDYNKNIKELNKNKEFYKSKYYDLAKYAMTKQKIFK